MEDLSKYKDGEINETISAIPNISKAKDTSKESKFKQKKDRLLRAFTLINQGILEDSKDGNYCTHYDVFDNSNDTREYIVNNIEKHYKNAGYTVKVLSNKDDSTKNFITISWN